MTTARQALAFVRKHGIVLEAAHGAAPSLAKAIAGGSIRGSWWAHSKGREIFALTRAVRDHRDVLVCRLVDGKITYVHRRMWPQVVREAAGIPRQRLAQITEVHTGTGRHVAREVPFPQWVPASLRRKLRLGVALALSLLVAHSAAV